MVSNEITTVKVHRETHAALKERKDNEQMSFDSVIAELLETAERGADEATC